MCLNCEYGYYAKCKLCEKHMCLKLNFNHGSICDICYKSGKVQYISKCRTCLELFTSRNKLFKHLNENEEHKREYNHDIMKKWLVWNIYHTEQYLPFNTWKEEYCTVGFRQ